MQDGIKGIARPKTELGCTAPWNKWAHGLSDTAANPCCTGAAACGSLLQGRHRPCRTCTTCSRICALKLLRTPCGCASPALADWENLDREAKRRADYRNRLLRSLHALRARYSGTKQTNPVQVTW